MFSKLTFYIVLIIFANSSSASGTGKVVLDETASYQPSWSAKVSVASKRAILEVDNVTFTFAGDSTDEGKVRISISENDQTIIYRYWPDISTWGLSEEGKSLYSEEFQNISGWRERFLHLRVDVYPTSRQVWLDDRLIREWQVDKDVTPRILLNGKLAENVFTQPEQRNRFLEIPLEHYFNNHSMQSFQPDAAIELDGGGRLIFETKTDSPHNLDLGQLSYREAHLKRGPYQRLSLPYINCDAMSSDPKRAIFRVPARFYHRLHLLCYSDNDKGEIPRATLRFLKTERARFSSREFGLIVDEGVHILKTIKIGSKKAVYMTIDLNPSLWQEFLTREENSWVEFELTQPVVMDNNSFMRPDGPPSSLHVLALALEEAPVSMVVTSDVAGHLFEDRAAAKMKIRLASNTEEERTGSISLNIAQPDGQIRRDILDFKLQAYGREILSIDLSDAPVGKSDITAQLSVSNESGSMQIMERHTSFVILPDFNRVDQDSPFGMWTFIEGHHGTDIRTTGDVLRKLGVKGTLANFTLRTDPDKWEENAQRTAILNEYGIKPNWGHLAGVARTALNGPGDPDATFAWIKAHPQVEYFNLFWETAIAGRPTTTCPPEIYGGKAVTWDEMGQKEIKTYMDFGMAWASRARQETPEKRLSFGNGFPLFTGEMLRAGFPQDYIDGFGLDFDMYLAAPEDQPSMWYAPFSGIYYLRELQKLYDCETKPIWLTEAIYCPTSPIWITEREQADYYVRAHLLALAMGVERFGMCAEPIDPDGWYHYGHYGPVGLCHSTPEMNPREAFSAYAAMTGLLDGARFDKMVALESPNVYYLRFKKQDKTFIHALWTVNGERCIDLQDSIDEPFVIYNRDGRRISKEVDPKNGSLALQLDESPRYLVGSEDLKILNLGETEPIPAPENTRCLIQFESLDDWEAMQEPLAGYEAINPATPVAWRRLDLAIENNVLRIRPPKENDTHPLKTICMVLRYGGEPVQIPETAQAIGLHSGGNRSWGRVVFVLQDKNGDRWVSARSQTPVDVDGKIYLETELPKAPSENQAGYRGYKAWQREKNDIIPEYPLQLTHLLFETRTHVIHGPDMVPLSNEGFLVESIDLR